MTVIISSTDDNLHGIGGLVVLQINDKSDIDEVNCTVTDVNGEVYSFYDILNYSDIQTDMN